MLACGFGVGIVAPAVRQFAGLCLCYVLYGCSYSSFFLVFLCVNISNLVYYNFDTTGVKICGL